MAPRCRDSFSPDWIYSEAHPLPCDSMNLFSHPLLLICLPVVLGLLIFIFGRSRKVARNRLQLLVSAKLLPRLSPAQSGKKEWIKFSLFCSALVFFILGLAGPQWGSKKRTINPQGIDVLIAVDLSKSMLARDIRPNRLERVKLTLINSSTGYRRPSWLDCILRIFLSSMPLDLDHQAFAKTLSDLQVGLLPEMAPDLSSAIKEASFSFQKDDSDKFLILLSDGEDLEGLDQAGKNCRSGRNQNFHYRYWFRWGYAFPWTHLIKHPITFRKLLRGKKCSPNWMKLSPANCSNYRRSIPPTGCHRGRTCSCV